MEIYSNTSPCPTPVLGKETDVSLDQVWGQNWVLPHPPLIWGIPNPTELVSGDRPPDGDLGGGGVCVCVCVHVPERAPSLSPPHKDTEASRDRALSQNRIGCALTLDLQPLELGIPLVWATLAQSCSRRRWGVTARVSNSGAAGLVFGRSPS